MGTQGRGQQTEHSLDRQLSSRDYPARPRNETASVYARAWVRACASGSAQRAERPTCRRATSALNHGLKTRPALAATHPGLQAGAAIKALGHIFELLVRDDPAVRPTDLLAALCIGRLKGAAYCPLIFARQVVSCLH